MPEAKAARGSGHGGRGARPRYTGAAPVRERSRTSRPLRAGYSEARMTAARRPRRTIRRYCARGRCFSGKIDPARLQTLPQFPQGVVEKTSRFWLTRASLETLASSRESFSDAAACAKAALVVSDMFSRSREFKPNARLRASCGKATWTDLAGTSACQVQNAVGSGACGQHVSAAAPSTRLAAQHLQTGLGSTPQSTVFILNQIDGHGADQGGELRGGVQLPQKIVAGDAEGITAGNAARDPQAATAQVVRIQLRQARA